MITIDTFDPNLSHLGYFIMAIGGFAGIGSVLRDVELVSLDPMQPLPDCLTQIKRLPAATQYAAGGLDYSSMLALY